ncbi:MAG: hypothetical protein ACXWCG_04155, partial [Flavitalea sp.]
FEIEQTTLACPDVLSLTLPEDEPGSFPNFLDHIWQLDHFQITEEDAKRNIMYKAEKERKQELIRHSSLEDFIHSLNIEVNIHPIEEKNLERAVQLTLRTNQFNLNGIRKSSEEIAKFIHQKNRLNWIIEVNDRFGDYGFAGLLIGRESGNALVLETFLLSCRVLGRNVEEVILEELRSYCMMRGLGMLSLEFRPTTKNQPFIQFLNNYKWESDEETNTYSLPIKNAEPKLLVK